MLAELLRAFDWRILALTFLASSLAYWLYQIKGPGLPPGPFPLPFFGNLSTLSAGPLDEVMTEWRKKYGDVFMFFMGTQRAVGVSGFENIKDLLTHTGDDFVDRPVLYAYEKSSKGFKGISFSNGQLWKENRKFASSGLRDMMGTGRQSLQEKVAEEATALREVLMEMNGRTLNMRPFLNSAVLNVVCSMVFGQRFERGNPELEEVSSAIRRVVEVAASGFMVNYMPWLRYLPFMASLEKYTDKVDEFVARKMEQHRATFDPSKMPRNFIDMFLKMEHGLSDAEKQMFNQENMQVIVNDLFVAGGETIVTTLLWTILFLVLNEDVQRRCREEIRSVLGNDGIPDMELRHKLHYVEATILESQRLGDIIAVGDPRAAARDTQFKGFIIPKGTVVMPLQCSVHRSSDYWEEPERFRPERWLDDDGVLVRHEFLLTFSLGRRNCIGEHVARVELFMFVTMLLQQFAFSVPEGQPPPSTDGLIQLGRIPHEYQVVVRKVI